MLEVDRIAIRHGDAVTCQDVSFTVPWGQVFGLAGAGRGAVVRAAAGVLTPAGGTVTRTATRVGYLPATGGLYQRMRVHDLLVYLAELHGLPVGDAHRAADIWSARFGLRDRREDRVRRLAAADLGRLRLAAVFVAGPDLLVLDEPYAELDRATEELLTAVLRERVEAGVAVLLSGRLDPLERVCDRVGVLHNGRMVAVGAVADLTAPHELVVDAPDARPGWAAALPGVTVVDVHNGRTRLALGPGADDQAVLAAALAEGPVRGFTHERNGLAAVFRDVVAE